jgi:uncharacterized membrane protein
MVPIHILAGLIALLAGTVALYALKGAPLHRKSGLVFVAAMLVMSGTGALMAVFVEPDGVNVVAGLLTFYLVCTALLTVRPFEQAREVLQGLMVAGFVLGLFAFGLGFEAMTSPDGLVNGIPAPPLFMFGVVGVVGGLLDARLLRAGSIRGTHRLARHVWRMGFAFFIATASFFFGQAQVFPEAIRRSGVLAVPVLIVFLAVTYWLLRLLFKRQRALSPRNADPARPRQSSPPLPAGSRPGAGAAAGPGAPAGD